MFVAGEGLRRPAAEVMATLLHEAAHAIANVRQIQDTSRQARYHNLRYRALAEELGLSVEKVDSIGWSRTRLREQTTQAYEPQLQRLGAALNLYRVGEEPAAPAGRRSAVSNNLGAAICACPRRIRVALSTLEVGPIVCGLCQQAFQIQGGDDVNQPDS